MERDPDRVLELFIAAVADAGGPGKILADHRTGWLPALMESSWTFVLQEEEHRNLEEIATLLDTTRDDVENMLTGPADVAPVRIHQPPPDDEFERQHIAGGLVRHAYSAAGLTP